MFVEWEQGRGRAGGRGNSRFLRLRVGSVKVRFLGRPVHYIKPPFRQGEKARDAFLSSVLVEGQPLVLDMSSSLYNSVAAYKEAGKAVNALVAPEYVINATGEGLERRYSVFVGEEKPLPEGLDVPRLEEELKALADALEQKTPRA